jgi:hypothetical protein
MRKWFAPVCADTYKAVRSARSVRDGQRRSRPCVRQRPGSLRGASHTVEIPRIGGAHCTGSGCSTSIASRPLRTPQLAFHDRQESLIAWAKPSPVVNRLLANLPHKDARRFFEGCEPARGPAPVSKFPQQGRASAAQVRYIEQLITETDSDLGPLLEFFGIGEFAELTSQRASRAIRSLEQKRRTA